MKIARAMVLSALVPLLLAGCGDNEFPTEPLKSQSAATDARGAGAEVGGLALSPAVASHPAAETLHAPA